MQLYVCFARITGSTNQHLENIGWHARVALLVATLGKTWVIVWNLHFFGFYIITLEMSVQKWNQLAEENSAVDQQTQDIHQKFRMDKISKEFGQLSGEELFKPITKRLDEKISATTQEVEESPDYAMDEFDRTNPFGEEFRPNAPTPTTTITITITRTNITTPI